MTRKIKALLSSTALMSVLAAGSMAAAPGSVQAGDRHDDRGRFERRDDRRDDRFDDHRDFDHRDNDRGDDVRIDVGRRHDAPARVWVEPVYRTVTDHVWHPEVTRTECQHVWVPDEYKSIPSPFAAGRAQRVLVRKGHYEDRQVQVCVAPGYYEDVCRQEVVTPGHWEECAVADNHDSFRFDVRF